jgi:membrane protein implicated in regulation of membrane protease activity
MRRLRWETPRRRADSSLPKRPYRDSALVYGGMAVVVVVIATLTGGSFVNAVLIAAAFFIVATLWSWRNWRNRLRAEQSRAEEGR